jgi:hypothetical protein
MIEVYFYRARSDRRYDRFWVCGQRAVSSLAQMTCSS